MYNLFITKITKHMSFTYKPKKRKRAKSHGFLTRNKSKTGKNTIQCNPVKIFTDWLYTAHFITNGTVNDMLFHNPKAININN